MAFARCRLGGGALSGSGGYIHFSLHSFSIKIKDIKALQVVLAVGRLRPGIACIFRVAVLCNVSEYLGRRVSFGGLGGNIKQEAVVMQDYSAQYALWDEFIEAWPISRLKTMTLDEYIKAGSTETFTSWIESRLDKMGSIWGG